MTYGIYHGNQNSFVICKYKIGLDYSKESISLCNKYSTDGFIVLKDSPLEMLYYNKDGTKAPMCGNGARCFVRFGYDIGIIKDKYIKIITMGGILKAEITSIDPFFVRIELGEPIFSPSMLGINSNQEKFLNEILIVNDVGYCVSAVFMNTHHLVIYVDEFNDVLDNAEAIHNHLIFKDKINVNFVIIKNNHELEIKTFERGVGWTLACGTGAASAFVISEYLGYVSDYAIVKSIGGELRISKDNNVIIMEGPVVTVKEPNSESKD